MKSVELTKNAASVFERVSLEDQVHVCEAVAERRRFDSRLVETIARLEGGMEFLQGCDSHLDERELAAVLNFSDDGVQARCLGAVEERIPQLAARLRRTMVLPELSPAENESLRLSSEVIEGRDDCILVSLSGYIDSYNADYFTQRLKAIVSGGYVRLILDCAGLNFISSAGIGAMTTLRNELSRRDGEICIVALQQRLREVFTLLCITDFFVFCEDRAEALRCSGQPRGSAVPDTVLPAPDHRETRRHLLQLDRDASGVPLATTKLEDDDVLGYGYAGMTGTASGEYLALRRLDENHVGAIVSDVSGKGTEAVHAMMRVAALFQSFLGGWRSSEMPGSLERFAYAINDALHGGTSPTTFCAYQALVLDGHAGRCALVHAGNPLLHVFDPFRGELVRQKLRTAPSAGSFSNDLVREKTGFSVEDLAIPRGGCLFLCNDGLPESHRLLRDSFLEPIPLTQGHTRSEQFGFARMAGIVTAALTRGSYELVREDCGGTTRRDVFDFSGSEGTAEDAILALAAAEEVFRLTPVPPDARREANHGAGIAVLGLQVDRLMQRCLESYAELFSQKARTLLDAHHYGGLLQDPPHDDVVLLGLGRKPATSGMA